MIYTRYEENDILIQLIGEDCFGGKISKIYRQEFWMSNKFFVMAIKKEKKKRIDYFIATALTLRSHGFYHMYRLQFS